MTRKRFWAGELMAYYEGTVYADLGDPDLEQLVLDTVSNGDGTTPITPLLSFTPTTVEVDMASEPEESPELQLSDFEQAEFATPTMPQAVDSAELESKQPKPMPLKGKSSCWPWVIGAGLLIVVGGKVIVDRKR